MKKIFNLQMWVEHFTQSQSQSHSQNIKEEFPEFYKKMEIISGALSRSTLSIQEIGENDFLFVVDESIQIKFKNAENIIVFQTLSKYVDFLSDTDSWEVGQKNLEALFLKELYIKKICRRLEDMNRHEKSERRKRESREKLLKSYDVKDLLARISDWEIEEKIDEVESELKSLLKSEDPAEYIPDKIQDIEFSLRNVLTDLRAEQKFSQLFAEKRDIDPDLKYQEPKIFSEYGFALFDYLMKNQLTDGRGKITDVSFFYRVMESDRFIHAKIEPFKKWVRKKYGIDAIEKIKAYDDVYTPKRQQAYTTAKEVFKFK